MNLTKIEWTHRPGTTGMTWNPIHAHNRDHGAHGRTGNFCTKISPGCTHCYAATLNRLRGNGLDYTVPNLAKAEFYLDRKELFEPLNRRKPSTIFVGDMFDLFHEAIPIQYIVDVFGVIVLAHWHTFQILTKRTARMREFMEHDHGIAAQMQAIEAGGGIAPRGVFRALDLKHRDGIAITWPPPNAWLGTSIEDQPRADERTGDLSATKAALHFLSVEPQLEAIDLDGKRSDGWWKTCPTCDGDMSVPAAGGGKPCPTCWENQGWVRGIQWVICGGESGPGARPFNLEWARSLQEQCKEASVPFFMKQIGAKPFWISAEERLKRLATTGDHFRADTVKDRKGGNIEEWPEELRVREFPA